MVEQIPLYVFGLARKLKVVFSVKSFLTSLTDSFTHSSICGLFVALSCLAFVSNAAMNRVSRYIFKLVFLFPLDIFPEVGLLDCLVVLFLIFGRSCTVFLSGCYQFTNSTSRSQGSLFSVSS